MSSSVISIHAAIRFAPGICWLLVLVLAPVGALRAEHHQSFQFSGDLGLGYDSNAGNSEDEDDVRSSSVSGGGLHALYTYRQSLFTHIQVKGSLAGEAYEAVEGLSNGRALGMLRVLHRPAGGFFSPSFAAWASAARLEYDSLLRDGSEMRLGVSMSQPLNTAFTARLTVSAFERDSRSAVFDLSGASAALNLDWRLMPALTLYGGYQFSQGDVVTTSSDFLAYAEVGEPEDAFQKRLQTAKSSHITACGSNTSCAYRLEANTSVLAFGGNHALSSWLSLDLQAQYVDSQAGDGTRYERWLTQLSLLVAF